MEPVSLLGRLSPQSGEPVLVHNLLPETDTCPEGAAQIKNKLPLVVVAHVSFLCPSLALV